MGNENIVENSRNLASATTLVICLLTVLLCSFVGLVIVRLINKPVKEIQSLMSLAQDGTCGYKEPTNPRMRLEY
jgi:hypothetical protein